ncbi:DNA polymerase III subunit chi [Paenalcaligenes niemegkensis]|uniref:DNA polymerase III subunit chi n=1 Tax=Paenalcaligenes niemegkensis TaxID=2895469 RepID=UPI001EE79453|nr:DNA polymerase III subunit chi [Paenalcaligenes niemegkensis]MCQ9616873.1 DNA polymerase III subunit chi [Paenalcaligenes niemegkensis]
MGRVDFAFGAPDRLRTACDVVRKQYLGGRRLIIYIDDARQLSRFDHLLWGFEPTAFVPHVRADDSLASSTPIVLCQRDPDPKLSLAGKEPAWLLNLSSVYPPNADRFERILEIVSQDADDREAARNRWRQYQSNGHEVRAHQLAS